MLRRKRNNKSSMHNVEELYGKKKRRGKYVNPILKTANVALQSSDCDEHSTKTPIKLRNKGSDDTSNTCYLPELQQTDRTDEYEVMSDSAFNNSDIIPDTPPHANENVSVVKKKHQPEIGTNNGTKKSSVSSADDELESMENDHSLIMILRNGHVILEYHMRSILTEGEWLQADVITSFLTLFNSKQFVFLGSNIWSLIEANKDIDDTLICDVNWHDAKNIVTWKNENGHFVLIWISLNGHFVSYINTILEAYEADIKARHATDVWNRFVQKKLINKLGIKPFKCRQVKHPYQQDSSSCGVLVCMLGYCIATDTELSTVKTNERAITRHREFIWRTFSANRDTTLCPQCRKKDDPKNKKGVKDKWVRCEKCGHYIHYSCAKFDYSMPEDEAEKLSYRCCFCC